MAVTAMLQLPRYDTMRTSMSPISVQTNSCTYPVVVRPGSLEHLERLVRRHCGAHPQVFTITSPEIWSLWGRKFTSSFAASDVKVHVLQIPQGERHKRLKTMERLAEELSALHARRDALLIAFGGGVIGDMTGFLAAIYMRGIRWVGVPTTYLAQIDSSLGGKTGVNLRTGKNLVGSFHHPLAVFTDPNMLSTLPDRELRAGMVESVKAAVLGGKRYFHWLERNLDALLAGKIATLTRAIENSIEIKAQVVGADERESGQRMLLNLGHTVGHAIESATKYRSLLHGEAVAWGMVAAVRLAVTRGALRCEDADQIEKLLFRLGPFPRFRSTAESLLELTAADKKHLRSARRFVLPIQIGKAVVVEDVSERELLNAIQAMLQVVKERGL